MVLSLSTMLSHSMVSLSMARIRILSLSMVSTLSLLLSTIKRLPTLTMGLIIIHQTHTDNYSSNTYRSSRNKIAAGLLAIFLGALGVHNFYLGFKGKAIAQLLISILSFGLLAFVSGIWAFIEGICILCSQPGSKWHKDADGAELQD